MKKFAIYFLMAAPVLCNIDAGYADPDIASTQTGSRARAMRGVDSSKDKDMEAATPRGQNSTVSIEDSAIQADINLAFKGGSGLQPDVAPIADLSDPKTADQIIGQAIMVDAMNGGSNTSLVMPADLLGAMPQPLLDPAAD